MIKSILLSFLIVACADAQNAPSTIINSAEQAVSRFQTARNSELQASLTTRQLHTLAGTSLMSGLSVSLLTPSVFEAHLLKDPLDGKSDPELRLTGTFAAVTANKNPTWNLGYSGNRGGSVLVYIDAVTGKTLYLCVIPEG